ncbi:MAG: hypothetical protein LBI68_06770 [Azoarcus sp.]|jgi:hypothetical protein|nr:hypothetical protein [Azoarcus sp.]
MLRIFPVLFVCATLAVGGCASTGGSTQNNANAVESEGDDGAVERTTSKSDARSSRAEAKREAAEAKREARERRREAKREKAAAKGNIQIVDVEKNFRGEIHGTPAKGSKFTQLRIGMSQNQVLDMIGPGTDSKGYITGKNFNPFYYGPDRYRIETFYKGSGRLVFTSQSRLITIIHDSAEDGYQ